jgi:hypothetical protein
MKLDELPIEEIEWEDHYSSDDWRDHDGVDLEGAVFVKTIGYRLKETRTKIIVFQNFSTSDQISGTMTILKKTVKSRTVIREGKK